MICIIAKRNSEEAQTCFRKLIVNILSLCNISKIPDQINEGYLYKFITEGYGNYTFNEIEKAVYFNQARKLNKFHEHFQVLDVNFLSAIMTDWLILKTNTKQRIAALLPPATIKLETNESLYQGLLNYININNAFPVMWAWSKVYQHMDYCCMISESNEEKRQIMSQVRAREKVAFELKQLQVADFIERSRLAEEFEEELKVNCRKELIIRRLEYLITPIPNDSTNATHD